MPAARRCRSRLHPRPAAEAHGPRHLRRRRPFAARRGARWDLRRSGAVLGCDILKPALHRFNPATRGPGARNGLDGQPPGMAKLTGGLVSPPRTASCSSTSRRAGQSRSRIPRRRGRPTATTTPSAIVAAGCGARQPRHGLAPTAAVCSGSTRTATGDGMDWVHGRRHRL